MVRNNDRTTFLFDDTGYCVTKIKFCNAKNIQSKDLRGKTDYDKNILFPFFIYLDPAFMKELTLLFDRSLLGVT